MVVIPVKIFFCYAHEDEELLNKLKAHLKPLQRQGFVDIWHDRDISAGTEWELEIKEQLNTAQIILLLVSPDFMNSDYCYSKEMVHAMERHERGEALVIPIILRPVYWQDAPFGKLQALPADAKAIKSRYWRNLDDAFFNVAEAIRTSVRKLMEPRQYEEMLVACEQSIRLNPQDAHAYAKKGYALIELRRYEEALMAFEQALRLDPQDAHSYNEKGFVLFELRRYEETLTAYEHALRFDPQNTHELPPLLWNGES